MLYRGYEIEYKEAPVAKKVGEYEGRSILLFGHVRCMAEDRWTYVSPHTGMVGTVGAEPPVLTDHGYLDLLIAATEAARPVEKPDIETGLFMYAFSADEIMDLRKHLLPNRMAHHDSRGDKQLRQHVNNIQKRRGKKRMD